ncbi:cupredoxin domain-containing protein [Salinigranum sp. GCM10025319]|uniref:cupredoxin domain-containing protein n=1 Tax=Salinigranum sp. GCM10025319 TaxID=3252687 RepID=UPI00360C4BBA
MTHSTTKNERGTAARGSDPGEFDARNHADEEAGLATGRRQFVKAMGAVGFGVPAPAPQVESTDRTANADIVLEASMLSETIGSYDIDDSGTIGTDELRVAIGDWRSGIVDTTLLLDIIDHWRTAEPIPSDASAGGHAWIGVDPPGLSSTNPTLELEAGEDYTLEWSNADDEPHTFVIADEDGSVLVESETLYPGSEPGTVEFTATAEMAVYYSDTLPDEMRGTIRVVGVWLTIESGDRVVVSATDDDTYEGVTLEQSATLTLEPNSAITLTG